MIIRAQVSLELAKVFCVHIQSFHDHHCKNCQPQSAEINAYNVPEYSHAKYPGQLARVCRLAFSPWSYLRSRKDLQMNTMDSPRSRIPEIFGSDSTHMTACVAYRDSYFVCQTGCHTHLTRDFYCPKSAGEAKASLHGAQPWATDGLILRPALRVWVSLTEGIAMP